MNEGKSNNTERVRVNIPEKNIINDGDVLFAWSASLDVKIWTEGKGALNQHIFKVVSKDYPRSFYYFELLNYLKHFKMMAELRKTTMGHITIDHLKTSYISIPPKNLIEKLYKDIYYLLKDIDKEGENDLAIQNGDLVIENGDFKLTGYQSRLHSLSIWLHSEICKKILNESPTNFINTIENFENNYLNKPNFTPEYKAKLDKIKESLKKERKLNMGEKETFWSVVLDWENLELKPNFAGIGINLNNVINKIKNIRN